MSGVPVNTLADLQTALFNQAEFVNRKGLSPRMQQAAGKWGMRVRKGNGDLTIDTNLAGVSGPGITEATIRVPFVDVLGANAGASYTASYQYARQAEGDNFLWPVGALWSHAPSSITKLKLQTGGMLDPRFSDAMVQAPAATWWHVLSALLWTDGSGIFGIGDGNFLITGNVIKLKNRASVHKFHRFQVLTFCDPTQVVTPGRLVTPRTGTVTITGISRSRGELTVAESDISVAIGGATNADWIVPHTLHRQTVDGVPELDFLEPPVGFFAAIPITDAEVAQPLFGVDRTADEEARAGLRVKLDAADKPEDVINKLAARLDSLPYDGMEETMGTLYFPSTQNQAIMEAFARNNITVRDLKDQPNDAAKWILGTAKQAAVFPSGHVLEYMSDKMLADPFVTEAEDNTWAVVLHQGWNICTATGGIGFQVRPAGATGGELLLPVTGNQQALSASFGAILQLLPGGGPGMSMLLTNNKEAVGRYTYV